MIVGEAIRQLRDLDIATALKITDYKRIIEFRNVLAHGYDSISDDIVWQVVTEKPPNLLAEVRIIQSARTGSTVTQQRSNSPRTPAKPRPVTASYLRNSAMHYLSQRAASVAMLRQTLERRAKRRLAVKMLEPETRALIETAITDLQALGLVNDARFAENRAASLARKGLFQTSHRLWFEIEGHRGRDDRNGHSRRRR